MRATIIIAAAVLSLSPALAQDEATIGRQASEAEIAKVNEALAKIDCKASEVEKESADLFEIDDAQCGIGQYDIKLNGSYRIISMTSDE